MAGPITQQKAPPESRGLTPVNFSLPGFDFRGKKVRATADGRVDIVDLCEMVCPSRHAAIQAVNKALTEGDSISLPDGAIQRPIPNVGFDTGMVSKVRWAGARGPCDSTVAPPNTAYALMMSLNTRGSNEIKAATATAMTRALGRLAGQTDEQIMASEAKTANPTLTNALSAAVGAPVSDAPSVHVEANPQANPQANPTANPTANPQNNNNVTVTVSHPGSPNRDSDQASPPYQIVPSAPTTLQDMNATFETFQGDPEMQAEVRQLMLTTVRSARKVLQARQDAEEAKAVAEQTKARTEQAKLQTEEEKHETERVKRRKFEAQADGAKRVAEIETASAAASALTTNGAMDASARRVLRTSILRVVDPSVGGGGPVVQASADLQAAVDPVVERRTALQHLIDVHQLEAPPSIEVVRQLRLDVHTTYAGMFGKQAASFVDADKVRECVARSRCHVGQYPVDRLEQMAVVFDRFAPA